MIAYCGLDCEECEAFIATRTNDDALRARVAEEWARLYHAPIRPEHINCTGCKGDGAKTYYCDQLCEIRNCAVRKAIATCADCAEYPCSPLNRAFRSTPEPRASQAKARLDALRI